MSKIQLGSNIALVRKNMNISQGELAEAVKVTQSYLSQIESGNKEASISLLEKICKKLRVPVGCIHMLSITKEEVPEERQFIWEKLNPVIRDLIKSIYPEKLSGL